MKLKEIMIDKLQEILNIKDDTIFTVTYPDEREESYMFSEHMFFLRKTETGYIDESDDWVNIILQFENLKIEMPDYVPKSKDKYWRIGVKNYFALYDNKYMIECVEYEDDLLGRLCVSVGNCFRTKEEAENHKEDIIKKLNSKF